MARKPADMTTKYLLSEKEMPTRWYNIQADFKTPLPPPLHPGTGQPIGPQDLAPLFPMELIKQEVSQERWIEIPDEVRDIYRLWRPTPLYRARRLEKALDTPARIYYKYEGVSPAGSHKPNTAVAQAYYNKQEKVARLATETGAGQWGSALSQACSFFGLQCKVYMVKVSYQQKPYRRILMETFGAQVVASPSPDTQAGKKVLEQDPNSPGSLGIAISEAVEDAATRDDTKYSLGSVLNHVLMHQTVIGLETKKQLEKADDEADVVVGCIGGGSNFAGFSFPFAADKLTGKNRKRRIVADRAERVPEPHQGQVRLRLRRHRRADPAREDAHPRPHLHPARRCTRAACATTAWPRSSASSTTRADRGARGAPARHLRGRGPASRGPKGILPAPEAAHAVRGAIDEALQRQEGRQAQDDRVQPLRPRLLRPLRLRGVPGGQAPGLRVPGGEGPGGAAPPAQGQGIGGIPMLGRRRVPEARRGRGGRAGGRGPRAARAGQGQGPARVPPARLGGDRDHPQGRSARASTAGGRLLRWCRARPARC